MKNCKHVLLASHGSAGAAAAEKEALSLCAEGAHLHHLIVVPDFWKGMMGDDWLNDSSTRDDYGDYVESQLENEIRLHIKKLTKAVTKKNIKYDYEVVVDKPGPALLRSAQAEKYDIAVVGSPRPKGKKGLRSRIEFDKLARDLHIPLLIIPYPTES